MKPSSIPVQALKGRRHEKSERQAEPQHMSETLLQSTKPLFHAQCGVAFKRGWKRANRQESHKWMLGWASNKETRHTLVRQFRKKQCWETKPAIVILPTYTHGFENLYFSGHARNQIKHNADEDTRPRDTARGFVLREQY